jgi:glycosyltransferase involved in cell wall biosynthesis
MRTRTCWCFPSLVGGIGLVCYEAMATGLPVITSDGDVVIRDGVDGLSVPLADIGGWQQALTALAADRERRRTLGAAGAERVKAFTWGRLSARDRRRVRGDLGPRAPRTGRGPLATSQQVGPGSHQRPVPMQR